MATHQRQSLGYWGVQTEASRITKPHSRHFLALSLFCLPLSFSFMTLHSVTTNLHSYTNTPIIFYLPYIFIFLTFFLCANATITYSAYRVLCDRPVKFICALKSLPKALLRLSATFFCALLIILVGFVGVGMIGFAVIRGSGYLGYEIKYCWVCGAGLAVFALGVLYLVVNCVLAPVIAVVELSWGFEPLRRSVYLVKGVRRVAACLLLYYSFVIAYFMWGSWGSVPDTLFWRGLISAITVLCSVVLMWFIMCTVVMNTVLYMDCKALRGETGEDDLDGEYGSVPFSDLYVVSVVQP